MPNPSKSSRPSKPHPDFPLFPHGCGQWAKKIKGRVVYFGSWKDPQAALERWLKERDYLLAGQTPPDTESVSPTLRDLCNHFLSSKERRVQSGELTKRAFHDYFEMCERILTILGKDTQLSQLSPSHFDRLRSELQRLFDEANTLAAS